MAVACAAVAFGLTLLLRLDHHPFLIPLIGVLLAAARGGLAAGLIVSVTTLLLANFFIVPPVWSFGVPSRSDVYELGAFFATAALISMLASRHRQTRLTLEATLSSIGDGVIVTDEHGRVTFLNTVAEGLTGWTLSEARGKPVRQVFHIVDEATRARAIDPAERTLAEGVIVGMANHTTLIARDGTERPIADSGAPIRDADGGVVGSVLVFRDATVSRQAEQDLKQQAAERQELLERERSARADAEHANRLKDEFLATLSHELRTPLNAVLGWSHMLTRRQLTPVQQKQALAAIHRNAQAQARLVDDVLNLSRIVTGRMPLAAEAVDLSEIVRSTAESFAPAILAKRQDVRMDLAPGADVTGDPDRLRQVVWHLLSNATKFTPEGGIIACRLSKDGDTVELTVTDTGQGIEPGVLPFVFDRFRQGDSSTTRGYGGLGLGLALVRHLVEAHGGTVFATSAGTGKGTAVGVRLPLRVPRPADVTAPHGVTPSALDGRRILVLDYDDDTRAKAAEMLESAGATVDGCRSADEALDLLDRRAFDAILADLEMAGPAGFEFIRKVRERNIQTPALAVGASPEDPHLDEAVNAGFGGFITSPITADGLLSALRPLMPHGIGQAIMR
jgi:PAS domain S-box-containing protein